MLILGFDTATEVTTIALASEDKVLADLALVSEKTQMERLMPLIDMILDQAGVKVGELDGIVVGSGPGLFTSLRIGVTTAKTLVQALDIPIVSISTLDVLAYSFAHSTPARRPPAGRAGQAGRLICSVIDAKRGEVFASLYQAVEGDVSEIWPPKVVSPQVLAQELSLLEKPVLLVGNGAWAYQSLLKEKLPKKAEVASAIFSYSRAANLISLAFPRFLSGEVDDTNKLVPIYIRKSDAEIAYERKKLT
jgi:tRNA threonylcarbamoyladenosine biosynthesis protein TsaB